MTQTEIAQVQQGIRHLTEFMVAFRASVDARFDRVDARADRLDARLERIEDRLDGMDARFDGMDDRFRALEVRIGRLETRMDALERRVAEGFHMLDGRIHGVIEIFGDHFRSHERRLGDIERKRRRS